jgi:type IV secretion system protein TrbL
MSVATCALDPFNCATGAAVGAAVGAAATSVISSWATDFAHAEAEMLSTLMTSWTNLSTPDVSDSSSGAIAFLQAQTVYLTAIFGIIGLMAAAARTMWLQRAEPLKEALAGLFRLVIVSGAAVTGIGLLTSAGDAFSTAVINDAVSQAGQSVQSIGSIALQAVTSDSLVIVLSSLAILGFLVQLVLLIVRSALLVLLAGTLPMSAAASLTPAGNQWFKKNVAWVIAFLLFKPVAALVYGAAILAYTSSADLMGTITGIVLLVLATLTLPALMRLVVPMVSAVGNLSVAAAAGAVIGAATGAVAIGATAGAAAPAVAGLAKPVSALGSAALGNGGSDGVAGGAGPASPPPPSSGSPAPSGSPDGDSGGAPLVGAGAGSGPASAPGP